MRFAWTVSTVKPLPLSLLGSLFLACCTASAQTPLDRVPIRYQPPTLLVEARVNGSKPLLFAFDTGATTCLIDAQVARRLGIRAAERPGPGGPSFARARTLAVGRAVAHDLELVIRDLSPLSQRVGQEVAGVIGFPWMEQFVFEIDYRAGTLILWPRTVELTPRADQLPLPLELHTAPGFTGSSLYIPATLDSHRCPVLLDTGSDRAVLGAQMAQQLGAGGKTTHTVTRLELAGRVFANVPFIIDARRGADGNPYLQCLLGNEQLKEFVLTVDIPRRRAFFRVLSPLPGSK